MNDVAQNAVAMIPDAKTPIALGVTKAALTKLKRKYAKVPDASTPEGYKAILDCKRELVPLRTGVIKEAKIQKEAAQFHINNINRVQNHIVNSIQAIEEPQYAERQRVDDMKIAEKREAEEAEFRRVAEIEAKVEDIQNLTANLLNASLDKLEKRLDEANKIEISDSVFMEFIEPASLALENAKTQLINAVNTAKSLAEQQTEINAKQKVIDDAASAQKLIDDERQKKMDEQQAAMDLRQKEFDDREAETLRLEEEKVEADRLLKVKEEADKQLVIDTENRADYLKDRMPEDLLLQDYIMEIRDLDVPNIEDLTLCAFMREAQITISDMVESVFEVTQKTK